MRDAILEASIESLRKEGLKFSVDTLSEKMKISKKTVYKYFPDKQALAFALYEKYFSDLAEQVQPLLVQPGPEPRKALLRLYFDSKVMTDSSVFNKFKLNQVVLSYTSTKSDALWKTIAASFGKSLSSADQNILRIIVDGAFEKLCKLGESPDAVIERLADLLW